MEQKEALQSLKENKTNAWQGKKATLIFYHEKGRTTLLDELFAHGKKGKLAFKLYLAAEEGYFAGSHRLDNSDVWEIRDSSNSGPRIYYVAMPNRPDTYLILAVGDKNSQQSIQKRTGDVHLAEKRLLDYHLRLQKGTWRDSPEGNMFSRIQNKLSTQKKRGVNGYGY